MADEETNQATQSEAGAETAGQGSESTEGQVEDYEGKYKALQAEHQRAIEERDEAKSYLEAVSPYVDFARMQSGGAQEEGEEKPPVTREEFEASKEQLKQLQLTYDFRLKHPELREYEKTVVGPAIARIRFQNPRMPIDKVLERAAEESKELLESERAKGRAEAEKKKAEAAAAGGLGSAATTSKKEDVEAEGEGYDEYIARRKKQSAKARGLI